MFQIKQDETRIQSANIHPDKEISTNNCKELSALMLDKEPTNILLRGYFLKILFVS